MNIKDHIEAGHYERDSKGRALVPMACGESATVLATDLGGVMGWAARCGLQSWSVGGRWNHRSIESDYDLLPPPPRKVKVTRYAEVRLSDQAVLGYCKGDGLAPKPGVTVIVPLTGEYEEPWPDAPKPGVT